MSRVFEAIRPIIQPQQAQECGTFKASTVAVQIRALQQDVCSEMRGPETLRHGTSGKKAVRVQSLREGVRGPQQPQEARAARASKGKEVRMRNLCEKVRRKTLSDKPRAGEAHVQRPQRPSKRGII